MSDHTEVAGATSGDDASGLLLPHLLDRRARDLAETESIDRAYEKFIFRGRRRAPGSGWLTESFLRDVHREMFGRIWNWAGKYRDAEVNIGNVRPHQIPEQVAALCGDFAHWDSKETGMPPFEVAARLQNRLTRIHPFKNGNGRHARLITDIFLRSRRIKIPLWPQIHLLTTGNELRARYIAAMKLADKEEYAALAGFIEDCSKAGD